LGRSATHRGQHREVAGAAAAPAKLSRTGEGAADYHFRELRSEPDLASAIPTSAISWQPSPPANSAPVPVHSGVGVWFRYSTNVHISPSCKTLSLDPRGCRAFFLEQANQALASSGSGTLTLRASPATVTPWLVGPSAKRSKERFDRLEIPGRRDGWMGLPY
jgi:hypothetical protein